MWVQDHTDAEGFKCWTYYLDGDEMSEKYVGLFGHIGEMETGYLWSVGYAFMGGGTIESGSLSVKSDFSLVLAKEQAERAYERLIVK